MLVIAAQGSALEDLRKLVSGLGHGVVCQSSLIAGLQAIASDPGIGIVLIDQCPDGIEPVALAREISACYRSTRPLVTIVSCAEMTVDTVLGALRNEVDDVIPKPIRRDEARRALDEASSRWASRAPVKQAERHAIGANWSFEARGRQDGDHLALADDGPSSRGVGAQAIGLLQLLDRVKRERNRLLNPDLFGDPAWEMLVDLMIARIEGKQVAATSACTATDSSLSTGLRWLRRMENAGLIRRWADPNDGRRDFVEVSDASFKDLVLFFSRLTTQG